MRLAKVLVLPALTLALAPGGSASMARAEGKPAMTLQAFAVNMSATGHPRAGTLDITIERWSTDEERETLRDALIEKGSGALLGALQKVHPRVGYIKTPTSLGWDIHYARIHPFGDGGSRVILATDRPMSFWELSQNARSADYEFTLAEIRIGKDGKGEGKLVTAAKIGWNKDTRTVEIENYGTEPVRLSEVRAELPKAP